MPIENGHQKQLAPAQIAALERALEAVQKPGVYYDMSFHSIVRVTIRHSIACLKLKVEQYEIKHSKPPSTP